MSGRARLLVGASVMAGLLGTIVLSGILGAEPSQQGKEARRSVKPDRPATSSNGPAGLPFPSPNAPLLFGVKSTLEEAETKAGFHLYRPDHPLANDNLITNVWVEETSTDETPWAQVVITYSSGLRMYLLPAWVDGFDKDPQSEYEASEEGFNGRAEAKVVAGHPALVVEAQGDGPAAIDLVVQGVRVQIIGGDAPVDAAAITAIAASIK
jgi:hypothetical protein